MTFHQVGAVASQVVDRWSWWRAALAGNIGPIHDGDAQQGYYRVRNQAGGFDPVAIFYPEGSDELVAYRSNREVRPDEIWTFACRNPVSFDAYQQAVSGGGWHDDDPTVAAQITPAPPGVGDNSGAVDEAEILLDQIEAAKKGAGAYKTITDDATLAKAQSLRSRLNELSGEADKKREALKRPHLEAGKAIDTKWQPLVKSAKQAADDIRAAMATWETKKLNDQREAERKAEQDRLAAQEAARKAVEAGKPAPEPEPIAAPVATAPAPIKGTYGKAASVSVKIVVKTVDDWPALAVYMSGHPENQELLRTLAQRALNAGRTGIPGITTAEEASVR